MEIENDRVMATLTVGEYKEVIGQVIDKRLKKKEEEHEFGFGLECIEKRYHVTKGTAQTYKNTFLKQAIMQHGRKIRVDLTLADKLYAHRNDVDPDAVLGDGSFK